MQRPDDDGSRRVDGAEFQKRTVAARQHSDIMCAAGHVAWRQESSPAGKLFWLVLQRGHVQTVKGFRVLCTQ